MAVVRADRRKAEWRNVDVEGGARGTRGQMGGTVRDGKEAMAKYGRNGGLAASPGKWWRKRGHRWRLKREGSSFTRMG